MATTRKKRREIDMVKTNTIKRYVKDVLDFKISKTSTDTIRIRANDLVKRTLKEARLRAKEDNRATIMPRDMTPAIEKIIGRKHLSPADLARELTNLSAAELADLAKSVQDQIKTQKAKGGN